MPVTFNIQNFLLFPCAKEKEAGEMSVCSFKHPVKDVSGTTKHQDKLAKK